ncbi:hypothetical protein TNCT6_78540 [Streptomyces sp. 6-11-2]|nr:hypothetical protein TNCT6_78540 [Streptomyces sp. 6-11-2]
MLADAGHEQGHVVGFVGAAQRVQQVVAGLLQGARRSREEPQKCIQLRIKVVTVGPDQAVGVQQLSVSGPNP